MESSHVKSSSQSIVNIKANRVKVRGAGFSRSHQTNNFAETARSLHDRAAGEKQRPHRFRLICFVKDDETSARVRPDQVIESFVDPVE